MNTLSLPDLSRFPHVAEVFDDPFRMRYAKIHWDAPDNLYLTICDADRRGDAFRGELESLLRKGAGLLDQDLRNRLRSGDLRQYFAGRAELEVWSFFSSLGFPLSPRPLGRPSKVLELRIENQPPIDVEVKAVIDRNEPEQRIASKLQHSCHRVSGLSGWVLLEITTLAHDFNSREFRRWLKQLSDDSLHETRVYQDKSGLEVKVTWDGDQESQMEHPHVTHSFGVRSSDAVQTVRQSLHSARGQLASGTRNLVVLRSFRDFQLDDWEMQTALYGPYTVYIGYDNRPGFRKNDGLLCQSMFRRISAVGLLRVSRNDAVFRYNMDVYPNDRAFRQVAWSELQAPTIRHLTRVSPCEMEWKES